MDAFICLLRKRFHEHPEWFRSDRITFIDSMFTKLWLAKYKLFCETANPDGSGRLVPPNCHDLYYGEQPEFCKTGKTWGKHIDEVYTMLNLGNFHWVALLINFHERHVLVWDSAAGIKSDKMIASMDSLCVMLGYVLNTLADPDEKHLYPNVPYSWEVAPAKDVPQNKQSGDCGVFALKYIECHSLGIPFPHHLLCDSKIKTIREKMSVEVYGELGIDGTEPEAGYTGLDLYDEK